MSILSIIIVLVILYILWRYFIKKEGLETVWPSMYDETTMPDEMDKYYAGLKSGAKSYMEKITNDTVDKETADAHYRDMVKQKPIYSSGAGYSVVDPTNTSPTFTNYTAFSKPEYVPLLPGLRQIYSENIEILKDNVRAGGLRAQLGYHNV